MSDKDMLARVMGANDSPTARLVALRRTPGEGPLDTGVWYSNFTRVKEEAERRGLPFFAMWTNGELCGYCHRFTTNILEPTFLERMSKSGGLWWLGGSMDDNEEDKRGGRGYTWCMHGGAVNYYPFFTVVARVKGRTPVEHFGSGADYDLGLQPPDGMVAVMRKIAEVFGDPGARARHDSGAAHPVKLDTVLHIRFNPDWDVQHIARFQHVMRERGGHCMCSTARTPDTMCMCKEFLERATPGPCRCGAFEKYDVRAAASQDGGQAV